MIRIEVRLFATLREAAGIGECQLTLDSGARGLDAKAALVARYPRLCGLLDYARLALNHAYEPLEVSLHNGDELSFIPPVSGG